MFPAGRPGNGGLTTQLAATMISFAVNCTEGVLPSAGALHSAPSRRNTKCIPAGRGARDDGPAGGVYILLLVAEVLFCNQRFQPIKLPIPSVSKIAAAIAVCMTRSPHALRRFRKIGGASTC